MGRKSHLSDSEWSTVVGVRARGLGGWGGVFKVVLKCSGSYHLKSEKSPGGDTNPFDVVSGKLLAVVSP